MSKARWRITGSFDCNKSNHSHFLLKPDLYVGYVSSKDNSRQ